MDKEKILSEELERFRTKPPEVDGMTTINHRARIELGLNCSEFVLMNFIAACVEIKHPYDWVQAYRKTGFTKEEQEALTKRLMQKGFIAPTQPATMTDKWYSAFTDLEKEFNVFWKDREGKNCWPGSKPKAFELFHKRRKEGLAFNFLMEKRNQYFEYLEFVQLNGFNRQKMMATVWLGDQKRYDEEWKVQCEEERMKFEKSRQKLVESKNTKPLSEKEFKEVMNR
jgi:hypothetical protein